MSLIYVRKYITFAGYSFMVMDLLLFDIIIIRPEVLSGWSEYVSDVKEIKQQCDVSMSSLCCRAVPVH